MNDSPHSYRHLLSNHRGLLAIIFLATFSGNLGQSFFIGFFQESICRHYHFSIVEFGTIYSGITLFSGFLVMYFGPKIDWVAPKCYAKWVLAGLLIGVALLTITTYWQAAIIGLGLIRFCGQGLLTHLGGTLAGREFTANRGRALGINSLAMPSGEILLPLLATIILTYTIWQSAWWLISAALLSAWIYLFLVIDWPPAPHKHKPHSNKQAQTVTPILDYRFWMLIPMLLVLPSTLTGIFVYQAQMTQHLGGTPAQYALALTTMGLIRFPVALLGGHWIDNSGILRPARYYLIPYALALCSAQLIHGNFGIWALMIGAGVSMSMSSSVADTLLVKLWGKSHLGKVRSLRASLLVFSTGIAPALFGYLLEHGMQFQSLLFGMLLYLLIAVLLAQYPIRLATKQTG